jgi:hypothetical protein
MVPTLNQSTQTLLKQWEEIQKNDLPQLKQQLGIVAFPKVVVSRGTYEGINQDEE